MILNSPYISGSLTVTGNTTIQGQLTVTGSLSGTASLASNALLLQGTGSTGFATTASINEVSASQQSISASLLQVSASYIALSGSYTTFSGSASTRITANSSSIQQISASLLQVSASYIALSGSYNTFSGSNSTILTAVSSSQQQISSSYIALSASYNTFSGSASTRVTQIEQVYATTGSNSFRANQSITGSLVVSSTITAQTLIVQTVTSSIVYSSGSNIFGCDLNSRQTFTGSVLITGSLTIAGASSATSYNGATIFGSTIACSPIGCFATSCATSFIGGTMSGTTIYGSTAVCSPVGKFTTCLDLGGALTGTSGTFSGIVAINGATNSGGLSVKTVSSVGLNIQGTAASALMTFTPVSYDEYRIGAGDVNVNDFGIRNATRAVTYLSFSGGASGGASIFSSTITGTTIYGSTAVCSPVGKFTTCIDAGSGTFSSSVTAATNITAGGTLGGQSLNITGTQSTFRIASNYTGAGDLLSGTLLYIDDVVNNNLTIIPSSAGTNGSKIVAAAYNGSGWRSMWEFGNVSSGNPNLILVKSGGNVGIGTTSPNVNGGLAGNAVLTMKATTNSRIAVIELIGCRDSDQDNSSYIMAMSNSCTTPFASIRFNRGATNGCGYITMTTTGADRFTICPNGSIRMGAGLVGSDTSYGGGSIFTNSGGWSAMQCCTFTITRAMITGGGGDNIAGTIFVQMANKSTLPYPNPTAAGSANIVKSYGAGTSVASSACVTVNTTFAITSDGAGEICVIGSQPMYLSWTFIGGF